MNRALTIFVLLALAAPGRSGQGDDSWRRPDTRNFRVELIEVAEDGLSFRKFEVGGTAKVMAKSLRELPDVHVAVTFPVMDYDDLYGPRNDGGAVEVGDEDEAPQPGRSLYEEIEQRITWQSQADWVRRVIRSEVPLDDSDAAALRKQFREVLKKQYTEQLRRQMIELQVLQRRLAAHREQLDRRAEAVDRVLDFELQRLELEADRLGLDADAQLRRAP